MSINIGNRYTTFLLNVLLTIFVLLVILMLVGVVLAALG